MHIIQCIQNRIYKIRGQRVMLDRDLAERYDVETKVFNQAVKRNLKRFPNDFMFQLSETEWEVLRSQIVTLNNQEPVGTGPAPLKFVSAGRGQHTKYLPYVFTEQGVAMLSGILNSDKATAMNIAIMRAFVAIRKAIIGQGDLREELRQLQERITEHDVQLSGIYDAIENLLDGKAAQRRWDERERIGFKK